MYLSLSLVYIRWEPKISPWNVGLNMMSMITTQTFHPQYWSEELCADGVPETGDPFLNKYIIPTYSTWFTHKPMISFKPIHNLSEEHHHAVDATYTHVFLMCSLWNDWHSPWNSPDSPVKTIGTSSSQPPCSNDFMVFRPILQVGTVADIAHHWKIWDLWEAV